MPHSRCCGFCLSYCQGLNSEITTVKVILYSCSSTREMDLQFRRVLDGSCCIGQRPGPGPNLPRTLRPEPPVPVSELLPVLISFALDQPMTNLAEYCQRAISIHVYQQPMSQCEVYSLETGAYQVIQLAYTSEYGKLNPNAQCRCLACLVKWLGRSSG